MMQELKLIKPNLAFEQEILAYKSEFPEPNNGIQGSSMLESFENVADWLEHLRLYEKHETLPNRHFVPGILFALVRTTDNKIVGMSHLRLELNDDLYQYGGHIGYSIAPSERKKGYGSLLLTKTLQEAKRLDLKRLLITCREDNLGSQKVIEQNNGLLENNVFETEQQKWVRRYWINIES